MSWRPPDWDVEKLVKRELGKAVFNTGPSWEGLIEAGADAILDALLQRHNWQPPQEPVPKEPPPHSTERPTGETLP